MTPIVILVEAEDASVCDAGYNVKRGRKYFQKKRRNKEKLKIKKKKDEDGDFKVKKEHESMDDLTGLYAVCNTKDKKVCGKIVKPIEPQEQIDTAELVKTLLAQKEEELLLYTKKKHKHRNPDHKKHKKRKLYF